MSSKLVLVELYIELSIYSYKYCMVKLINTSICKTIFSLGAFTIFLIALVVICELHKLQLGTSTVGKR